MLAALLAAVATASCGGCGCPADDADVSIAVISIALRQVSLSESVVQVALEAENRNPEGAVLDQLEYDIYAGHKGKWIWFGRGQKAGLDIEVEEVAQFAVTTAIDATKLRESAAEQFFGTEPSEMKVDGRASFRVGEATVEVRFEGRDTHPL